MAADGPQKFFSLSELSIFIGGQKANVDQIRDFIPADDTTPLISEGTEILSLAVTTASATEVVELEFVGFLATTASVEACAAIFRDSTCIKSAAAKAMDASGNGRLTFSMKLVDIPGAAAAYTYSVRVGPGTTGTIRVNGTHAARYFNGTAGAVLVTKRIEP